MTKRNLANTEIRKIFGLYGYSISWNNLLFEALVVKLHEKNDMIAALQRCCEIEREKWLESLKQEVKPMKQKKSPAEQRLVNKAELRYAGHRLNCKCIDFGSRGERYISYTPCDCDYKKS
jgi:hypothetical protein